MKKRLLVITGIILTVAIFFALKIWREPSKTKSELEVVQNNLTANKLDSDEDGLFDWQEGLWDTDPHKFDTDADGTSDGREVATGHDPKVKGPNDIYSKPLVATNIESGDTYKYDKDINVGKNLTEQVSINLITNYLDAKSLGIYSPTMGDQIAEQAAANITNVGLYNNIELSDLNIGPVTTSASVVIEYATAVNSAATLGFAPGRELGEVQVLKAGLSGGDYSKFKELIPYIDGYKASTKRLLAIRVPSQFAQNHLEFVRAFDSVTLALQGISKATVGDPLVILQELQRYELAMSEIQFRYNEGSTLANKILFE